MGGLPAYLLALLLGCSGEKCFSRRTGNHTSFWVPVLGPLFEPPSGVPRNVFIREGRDSGAARWHCFRGREIPLRRGRFLVEDVCLYIDDDGGGHGGAAGSSSSAAKAERATEVKEEIVIHERLLGAHREA